MSFRHKTYNGLIWWNHIKKEIHLTRSMNPPTYHARFCNQLKYENPGYTLVEDYK